MSLQSIVLCHIQDIVGRGLIPLQSQGIPQPQPTGPLYTRWIGFYPTAVIQSVYYTATANWATVYSWDGVLPHCRDSVGVFHSHSQLGHRTLVGGSYPTAEMKSVYSTATASANWATVYSLDGVLPHCRDAVGVFHSHSQLGHRKLVDWSYLSAKMQSANWATGKLLGTFTYSAEMQSANWATGKLLGALTHSAEMQ